MSLRTAICPRKARKVLFASFPRAASCFEILQCRSGFATPTETFQGLNRLRNVSDGVANPVTLRGVFRGQVQCRSGRGIVPTLRRGNAGVDAPASRNLCGANVFGDESVFRNAGALRTEFPRRSVGTMHRYIVEFFVLSVSFTDKKL